MDGRSEKLRRALSCAPRIAPRIARAAHRLAADADVERLLVEVRVGERPARRVADGALLDREPRARVEDERRERRHALRHQLRVLLLGRAHKVLDAAAVDEDGAPAARSAVGPRVLQRDRRDVEDLEVEAARRRDDLHEPLHHAGVPRAVAPRELLQWLPRVDHEWSASRVRRSEHRRRQRQHRGRGNVGFGVRGAPRRRRRRAWRPPSLRARRGDPRTMLWPVDRSSPSPPPSASTNCHGLRGHRRLPLPRFAPWRPRPTTRPSARSPRRS